MAGRLHQAGRRAVPAGRVWRWLFVACVVASLVVPAATPPPVAAVPILVVEAPPADQTVLGRVAITGWAVDLAPAGPARVEEVSVWLDGGPTTGGALLGRAEYSLPREDVVTSLGPSAPLAVGFRFEWDTAPLSAAPGPRRFVVAALARGVWAESDLTLTVAAGPDPDPGVVPAHDLPAGKPVTIEGVDLLTAWTPRVAVFYEADVPLDRVHAAAGALNLAVAKVPDLLGLPAPRAPIVAYLFSTPERYLRGTSKIVGLTPDAIGTYTQGHSSFEPSRYPGIYCSASVGVDPAALAHLLTHEYVHHVAHAAARNQAFAQWFDEGLANAVAFNVLRPYYPESENRRYAFWLAEAARAQTAGRLVPLREIESPAAFIRAGNGGRAELLYAQSLLAVESLARRVGLRTLASILPAVGAGRRWAEVFRSVAGMTLEQFAAEFPAALGSAYPTAVPSVAPPGTRFFAVLTGFRDGEVYLLRVARPDGQRGEPQPGLAIGGVVETSFAVPAGVQSGVWTLEATGDFGSRSSVSFTVGEDR